MRKLLVIIALAFVASLPLAAQQVEWSLDANFMLNNREGGNDEAIDQTFFFTRLAPEVGVSFLDGEHLLKGGVSWYQPMFDNLSEYKIVPTIYYRFRHPSNGFSMALGWVPRTMMVRKMPTYLWSDSLNYTNPNIRGGIAQLVKPNGFAEIFIDWRQIRTDNKREAFMAALNTEWRVAGPLHAGGHIQYSHLAKSYANNEGQAVNDDVNINPMLALDFSHRTALDSLRIAAGAIYQLEHDRNETSWRQAAGFVLSGVARWRWLEVEETLYAGKELYPLYPRFNSRLVLGDPYYRAKVYSRTDINAHIAQNRFMDLSIGVSLHANSSCFGFWQQLSCRFYIDNLLWRNRHDKNYLRNGKLRNNL